MTPDRRAILALDTATSAALLALGDAAGGLVACRTWTVGYRHGETLLPTLEPFLAEHGTTLADLAGIVVGTGPGAFTGLRVGIATAKGLAHALGIPIAGVSTAEALLAAADAAAAAAAVDAAADAAASPDALGGLVLLVPAGPNDRVLVRSGAAPVLLPGGQEPVLEPGERLVAVDLAGRAPDDALARGQAAAGEPLAAALLRLGAARLDAATPADLERLVPEYVTLPRGVTSLSGDVTWSRDPR